MRIMIINQTFHPDVAATAQIAFDLAEFLTAHGHQVQVVTSRSLYGKTGAVLPRRETVKGIEIHRVGMSLFGKKSILLRVMDFGVFYLLATIRALTLRKADVVITLTTPPFIAFLGTIIKLARRSKFVYWVMDLYPDLPIACGVMKEKG